MINQSNLKTQYPLSPNKFKKKMVEKGIVFFVLAVIAITFGWIGLAPTVQTTSTLILILGSIAAAIFIIPMIIYGVYVHYYIKLYFYEDEEDFLTIKKGVITPAEIHVQYGKIQDVYVDQDILDRIFGIYDVHISSATFSSGIAAHIDGVDKYAADGLKALLLQKIKRGSLGSVSMSQSNSQASSTETVVTQQTQTSTSAPVSFSKSISSEEYGLDTNWWIGEITKIALASVFMPAAISIWILGGIAGGNWKYTFWIWFGILIVYVVYRTLYLYLWKTHYQYNFGPEYIYMKIGVIAISEKNMGYNSIQDVNIKQSIVDRIFGVADLIIENASGAMMMPVSGKGQMVANNGITIEGLLLQDAQDIAKELKHIISSRTNSFNKGL